MLRLSFAIFGLVIYPIACLSADENQLKSRSPSMTVPAEAVRAVVPDTAVLNLSVSNERPTAAAASEETEKGSRSVLAEIKSRGIDARDIRTDFTLSPVYDEERIQSPLGFNTKRTFRGYKARNAITVRLRETAKAGSLARALIEKGANHFDGMSFEVAETQSIIDELRVQATKEAVRRAQIYAQAAGVRLGRVLTIEPDAEGQVGEADLPRRASNMEGKSTAIVPVEPGVERLSARVSITFEIVP